MHLTMLLLSAIAIASSCITSKENAFLYLQYMIAYWQKLEELFPNYNCCSIYHMAMYISEFLVIYDSVHG
jgi:hypothetical protein